MFVMVIVVMMVEIFSSIGCSGFDDGSGIVGCNDCCIIVLLLIIFLYMKWPEHRTMVLLQNIP